MSNLEPNSINYADAPDLQATCYLLGEMSPAEEFAYEQQLTVSESARADYEQAVQLLVLLGREASVCSVAELAAHNTSPRSHHKKYAIPLTRQVSLLAGFCLMFILGLFAGRFSMQKDSTEPAFPLTAHNQADEREVTFIQRISAAETPQLAAAWFDLQSQSQSETSVLSISILEELEPFEEEAEITEAEIAEAGTANDELPYWLLAGLELQQASTDQAPPVHPLSDEEAL